MTKYFDEFAKLKQKEMAKQLEDITYKYINPKTQLPTKVPASHYEKEFNREIEREISAGVSRQFLIIMYTTLANLKKESSDLFFKALLCLDNNINPKDMRFDEQIALEKTYDELRDNIFPQSKRSNYKTHLLNDLFIDTFDKIKNSEEVQAEVMRMIKFVEDSEDEELNSIKKKLDNKFGLS